MIGKIWKQCMGLRALSAPALMIGAGAILHAEQPVTDLPRAANVAKARCGPGDNPERGLQGQVPLAERKAGYKGAHCNLTLVSSIQPAQNPGGLRLFTMARDRSGHLCGYASGSVQDKGTSVVDMTDPTSLVETALLTSPGMMGASEGLKANETRGLLASGRYVRSDSNSTDPDDRRFDVYDIGTDCRHPRLLASVMLPFATDILPKGWKGYTWPNPDYAFGHEGNFAPDGLTYYMASTAHGAYHAIDLSDPSRPKILDTFVAPNLKGHPDPYRDGMPYKLDGSPHSLSVSIDGKRAYLSTNAVDMSRDIIPQSGEWRNGYMVVDTSEIEARKPGGRMRFIAEVNEHDGGGHHGPIEVKIKGRPYIIDNDEFGAGQLTAKGRLAACAAGLNPNAAAQIWDLRDEKHPKRINRLVLESNDPAHCAAVAPETEYMGAKAPYMFLYDPHQCSVDNRENATVLACSYFEAGVRVFDIRDPLRVKEIAYFDPPALPGEENSVCGSMPRLDAEVGMLYSYCASTGFFVVKFRKGVWPFPQSRTPPDRAL